jgi:hypothetical protein
MFAEVHRNIGRKTFGGRAGCSGHGRLNHRAVHARGYSRAHGQSGCLGQGRGAASG